MPPVMNVSTAIRLHRFMLASFFGLPLLILTLIILVLLMRRWHNLGWRCPLFALLVVGFAAQVYLVFWLTTFGIHQLSPPMAEGIFRPYWDEDLMVSLMIVIFSVTFSWALLARPSSHEQTGLLLGPRRFFHETWYASLLLGIVALAHIVSVVIVSFNTRPRAYGKFDWDTLSYAIMFTPSRFIWLASIVGGFSIAWTRFRRRHLPLLDSLPNLELVPYAVLATSLALLFLSGAVFFAASTFSFWFIRFRTSL